MKGARYPDGARRRAERMAVFNSGVIYVTASTKGAPPATVFLSRRLSARSPTAYPERTTGAWWFWIPDQGQNDNFLFYSKRLASSAAAMNSEIVMGRPSASAFI